MIDFKKKTQDIVDAKLKLKFIANDKDWIRAKQRIDNLTLEESHKILKLLYSTDLTISSFKEV